MRSGLFGIILGGCLAILVIGIAINTSNSAVPLPALTAQAVPSETVLGRASATPVHTKSVSVANQNVLVSSTQLRFDENGIPFPPAMPSRQSLSDDLIANATLFSATAEKLREVTVITKPGDTFIMLLQDAGMSRIQAHQALQAIIEVWNPRDLKPGQVINLVYADNHIAVEYPPAGLYFEPDNRHTIMLHPGDKKQSYKARKIVKPLTQAYTYARSVIDNNLFEAGGRAGVPVNLLVEMIRGFSYSVDFQRDIHPGDKFEIIYEKYINEEGRTAGYGKIAYAAMELQGKRKEIFYHRSKDNKNGQFYSKNGDSVRRALLLTPIDGARISSGFGLRRHPILGYSKMHKGVDFAAPTGTPIRAAGSGKIVRIGWNGGFGKYIRIRHNNKYETAYAHAHRFRKGLKKGSRVAQGDVIAYVGTTGRSTGPHLHYEVLVHGRQINPRSAKLPVGHKLVGQDKKDFDAKVKILESIKDKMRGEQGAVVAQASFDIETGLQN